MAGDVVVKVDAWKRILRDVKGLDKFSAHVGILASKGGAEVPPTKSVDGTSGEVVGELSLLQIAAIHEFGSRRAGVPERSFIRRTFIAKRDELVKMCARLCREVITRGMNVEKAYALLGQWGAAEVKKTITEGEGVPPPNAPRTVLAKGSSRPLVDTGRLVGAISYEVVSESGTSHDPGIVGGIDNL